MSREDHQRPGLGAPGTDPAFCWALPPVSARPVLCSISWLNPISPSFQKFRVDMPGSGSAFIPTINAITTSQDLQWMVQPTVITSMSNPYTRSHPYSPLPGLASVPGHMALPRPGVIKTIGTTVGRRRRDEQVTAQISIKKPHRWLSGPRDTVCFLQTGGDQGHWSGATGKRRELGARST